MPRKSKKPRPVTTTLKPYRGRLIVVGVILAIAGFINSGAIGNKGMFNSPAEAATSECVFPGDMERPLSKVWEAARLNLEADLHTNLKEGVRNPYILYWTQEYLHSFIIKSNECNNRQHLEQASKTIGIPFGYQTPITDIDGQAAIGWACGTATCPAYSPEKPTLETFLYSSQFMYLVSRTLNAVSDIPLSQRSYYMKGLYKRIPTVVNAYDRWLFGGQNYYAKVMNIPNSTRIDDKMMLMAGGMTELYEIYLKEPEAFEDPALQDKMAKMLPFIEKFGSLIDTRTKTRYNYTHHVLYTFDDIWGNHADHKCAAYTGFLPPKSLLCTETLSRLSMDISHLKRLVWVLDSYRHQTYVGSISQFRLNQIVSRLSNQFTIKVVRGAKYDIASGEYAPGSGQYYRNYFSGTEVGSSDGWYRVKFNADGSFASGSAPFGVTGIPFPYFLWAKDDPKMRQVMWAWYDHYGFDIDSKDKEVIYTILRGMPTFASRS